METNPIRVCELLVGLPVVNVLGVDAVSDEAFNSAWRTGTSLATDEVVERARQVLDAVAPTIQQSTAPAFGPT